MKHSVLLAASSLLGSASAAVHTAKLQKVPLGEQLVSSTPFDAIEIIMTKATQEAGQA